jgi:hypothetical protein
MFVWFYCPLLFSLLLNSFLLVHNSCLDLLVYVIDVRTLCFLSFVHTQVRPSTYLRTKRKLGWRGTVDRSYHSRRTRRLEHCRVCLLVCDLVIYLTSSDTVRVLKNPIPHHWQRLSYTARRMVHSVFHKWLIKQTTWGGSVTFITLTSLLWLMVFDTGGLTGRNKFHVQEQLKSKQKNPSLSPRLQEHYSQDGLDMGGAHTQLVLVPSHAQLRLV